MLAVVGGERLLAEEPAGVDDALCRRHKVLGRDFEGAGGVAAAIELSGDRAN
jgi:hypothetical protein